MYKYNYVLTIFSSDESIIKTLENLKVSEKINLEFKSLNKFDKKAMEKSNIIIFDDELVSLDEIELKDKKVVVITDKFKKSYGAIDGVVLKPIDYNYLFFIIDKIYKNILLEEDYIFLESLYETTIDGAPDMFWVKTLDGIHMALNKKFCEVIDKKRETIINKDHYFIWDVSRDDPNSGADLCKETEDKVIEAGKTLSFSETVKSKNGIRQLITYKTPLYDKFNNVVGTCGYGHDITDLENMSIEMDIVLNSVPYALLIRDDEGDIISLNDNFCEYFGVKKEDIIGMSYSKWAGDTFYPDREINEDGYVEAIIKTKYNNEKITELRFDNIKDTFDNVTGQICMFRDVTLERKIIEENLLNSNVDFMTKLYNRRYLDSFISECKDGETITLFAIDLDHFKSINDTYGHKTGDEAIILAGDILKNYFVNDLVVRMGGDEFLVVKLGNISSKELEDISHNLLVTFTKTFEQSKKFKVLSASVGISQGVIGKNDFDKLLAKSDDALYDAKEAGRARYVIAK